MHTHAHTQTQTQTRGREKCGEAHGRHTVSIHSGTGRHIDIDTSADSNVGMGKGTTTTDEPHGEPTLKISEGTGCCLDKPLRLWEPNHLQSMLQLVQETAHDDELRAGLDKHTVVDEGLEDP